MSDTFRWSRNGSVKRIVIPYRVRVLSLAVAGLGPGAHGLAEPVRNGNDYALEWSLQTNTLGRARLLAAHTNLLHAFRYLRVERIEARNGGVAITTREPAADLPVEVIVEGGRSLELARTLAPGESVAARGRLHQPNGDHRFVLRPALLDFKDRSSPKAGKELLREVDPRAR